MYWVFPKQRLTNTRRKGHAFLNLGGIVSCHIAGAQTPGSCKTACRWGCVPAGSPKMSWGAQAAVETLCCQPPLAGSSLLVYPGGSLLAEPALARSLAPQKGFLYSLFVVHPSWSGSLSVGGLKEPCLLSGDIPRLGVWARAAGRGPRVPISLQKEPVSVSGRCLLALPRNKLGALWGRALPLVR